MDNSGMLERVLKKIKKMTVEDYNELYDKVKNRESISIIFIDWTKYFNDKKIYLKRFESESTCNGCFIYENKMICKSLLKQDKFMKICEDGKCIEKNKTFIYKKVVPLKRYMI